MDHDNARRSAATTGRHRPHHSHIGPVALQPRRVWTVWVPGAVLFVELVVLIFLQIRMNLIDADDFAWQRLEQTSQSEAERERARVEQLQREVDALGRDQLPSLPRLVFDRVIPVEREFIKSIVFTLSGRNDQRRYDYNLVMQNTSLNLVHPQFDLQLFDRLGVQVGLSRIGVQKDGTPTLEMLDRGEIRSVSATIEPVRGESKPEYFRLLIRN